jgi:hypothetical protein
VTNYTAPKFQYFARTRSPHAGRSRSEAVAAGAIPKLTPGAGLIVSLLLSLGLWGAIWQAGSSLAGAWLR